MSKSCCLTDADNVSSDAHQPIPSGACPTNGQIGKIIDSLTLKALLARPLTEIRDINYRFCPAPDCPTVYYSADGVQLFAEPDLREYVYQKHAAEDAVPVCYCFQHTVGSIRAEIERTGSSTVVAQISAGIQAGQCACDIRNPQGTCCLGNVRTLVQQLEEAYRARLDVGDRRQP
jgi:hypothetical protein